MLSRPAGGTVAAAVVAGRSCVVEAVLWLMVQSRVRIVPGCRFSDLFEYRADASVRCACIPANQGAGKSSLMLALYRLVEPSADSSVVIDGQDIMKIGLNTLRSNLCIIPQVRSIARTLPSGPPQARHQPSRCDVRWQPAPFWGLIHSHASCASC